MKFVIEFEKIDYWDAVKILSKDANIDLTKYKFDSNKIEKNASEKEAMNASPMWMQRYMELTMRYSKMTQELSKKQPGSC